MTNRCIALGTIGRLSAVLVTVSLLPFFVLAGCSFQEPPPAETPVNKMLEMGENLVFGDLIYAPLTNDSYCEALDGLYAITDTGLQVFKIAGHDSEKYVCLLDNGQEFIFQNKGQNPIFLTSFPANELIIGSQTSDEEIHVLDSNVITNTIERFTDSNLVETPDTVLMYARVSLLSSKYAGIRLSAVFLHDEQDNCYIMDQRTGQTWLIGHELMEYLDTAEMVM